MPKMKPHSPSFFWSAVGSLAFAMFVGHSASAAESFETPALAATVASTTLPIGWSPLGTATYSIVNLAGTGLFSDTASLSAPAGGSQALRLSGANSGVYYMTGITIESGRTYTAQAAIGNAISAAPSTFWSIQLWADESVTGSFGSAGDQFLGQTYGEEAGANNASAGNWALNSVTVTASDASLVGKQLVVFLNNYRPGTSYYDNVSVGAVPEPETYALFLAGLAAVTTVAAKRRRKTES